MDIRMPKMDGIEATRRIVRAGLPTRVLVLTTFDADDYVVDAFRAGASGFLLKNAPAEQLGLIARGMSNQEIADQLIVSVGTVKTYVTRLLSKIELRDRVHAVIFAYENGIATPGQPTD